MERSLRTASPHTRRLFEKSSWDAERVESFANEARNITIATVTKRGNPHAASAIVGALGGTIFFSVSPGSMSLRNIRRDPAIAFTILAFDHGVIGQGQARLEGHVKDIPDVLRQLGAVSRVGRFTPQDWDGYVYSIDLKRLFAE